MLNENFPAALSDNGCDEKDMNKFSQMDEGNVRVTAEYAEAKTLFEERQQAQARVVEIDRALRELRSAHPAIVDAIGIEIPLRRPRGKPALPKHQGSTRKYIVEPVIGEN